MLKTLGAILAVFAVGIFLGLKFSPSDTKVQLLNEGRSRVPASPEVKCSLTLNDPALLRWVQNRVKWLDWADADGKIVRYRIAGPHVNSQNLTLSGSSTLAVPDDHGRTQLAVTSVDGSEANIAVLSEFYHQSFGKNLITVDSHILKVPVTPIID